MAKNWEDIIDEQAKAFAHLCAQDPRISELAEKQDGPEGLTASETAEFFRLTDKMMNNPFFFRQCLKDWEDFEE